MKSHVSGYIITENSIKSESSVIGDKNDRLFARGYLQDLDVVNRNTRIYTKEEMDPDLYSDRIQKELIPTGNMKGEANHPLDKSLARQQVVDIERSAVVYHKIWREGNLILGEYCGTNNSLGDYFNKDLASGYKPSFSLRALGSIETEGGKSYVRNIRIITYDWVILPSHKIAYTQKIIDNPSATTESSMPDELRTENASIIQENTIPIMDASALSFIKAESANIKSVLENFDVAYSTAQLINEGSSVALTDPLGTTFVVNVEEYIKRQYMDDLFR